MNATEQKPSDITSDIRGKSYENVCESTGSQWTKECPRCHRIQTYSNKYKLERAIHDNSKCFECGQLHRKLVEDADVYYRNCPACNGVISYEDKPAFYTAKRKKSKCTKCRHVGIKLPESAKRKLSELAKQRGGHPHTQTHRERIAGSGNPMYGVHRYDELNPFYGKRHTEETRRKMRVAMCHKILQKCYNSSGNTRICVVGKNEQAYFDQLEKENGWFGNRQHFVSHLGYFVDYYEPALNIVVEYDEPRHYRHGRLREKDLARMEQIKAHLGCEFWRYDAYRKQLLQF